MPENRYDNNLREGNQLIINLTPANYTLRIELAFELKRLLEEKDGTKVLELGIGEGDLTRYLLKNNKDIQIDGLDISKEMLEIARGNLEEYSGRINFIEEDALSFLSSKPDSYGFVTSAWTIHNFPWKDKIAVFEAMFSALSEGGTVLLMDKVYPDSEEERERQLSVQLARYRYLVKELRIEITNHERQGLTDEYRMDETQTFEVLRKVGFKNIRILDRVERDVLLVAEK